MPIQWTLLAQRHLNKIGLYDGVLSYRQHNKESEKDHHILYQRRYLDHIRRAIYGQPKLTESDKRPTRDMY